MNRQSIAAVLLVAASTCAAGVEPGFPASEPFERIHVRGPATLEIRQGRSPQVAVTAVDRVLADVAVDVSDGTLFIEVPDEDLDVDDVRFAITTKELRAIYSEHAVRVVVNGLTAGHLSIKARGAGSDYHLAGLLVGELSFDVRGALNAVIAGRAERQNVAIAGASTYRARELSTAMADLRLRGASSSEVWVTDRLDVDIAGSGSVVTYRGSPRVTKYIHGWGYVGPNHAAPRASPQRR